MPYKYTGRYLDYETGLYYYRARYYSPELGRFLQTDPIGYGDQMNMYAYVGNDPMNNTDPSGLETYTLKLGGDFAQWLGGGGDVGVYITPGWFWLDKSEFDFGVTWELRESAGTDSSVQLEIGAVSGDSANLIGKSTNVNVGVLAVEGTFSVLDGGGDESSDGWGAL